jgi:hypothetical protein
VDKFSRRLLWALGTLAVFWTVANVVTAVQMPADCPTCAAPAGAGAGQIGAMAPGADGTGAWRLWMMATALTTWLVMIILDAVFLSLVLTTVYRRHAGMLPMLFGEANHGTSQRSRMRHDDRP